jgi:hypothetical protein
MLEQVMLKDDFNQTNFIYWALIEGTSNTIKINPVPKIGNVRFHYQIIMLFHPKQ